MKGMRSFRFQRFGAGQPEVLKKRVKYYSEGMPCPKTGFVFFPRCNMEDKLNALEKEKEYLVDMCPKNKRDNYEDGKETTLTRIIIRSSQVSKRPSPIQDLRERSGDWSNHEP